VAFEIVLLFTISVLELPRQYEVRETGEKKAWLVLRF
jgi:hypothetical protein